MDWPEDISQLADALEIGTFAVLGASGGGPYAAACAYKIPQRLTATAIVCGMGPAEAPGLTAGIAWTFPGRGSFMRTVALWLMSLSLRKKPEMFARQIAPAQNGPDKALVLAVPGLSEKITALQFAESFRGGIAGVHHDAGFVRLPGSPATGEAAYSSTTVAPAGKVAPASTVYSPADGS